DDRRQSAPTRVHLYHRCAPAQHNPRLRRDPGHEPGARGAAGHSSGFARRRWRISSSADRRMTRVFPPSHLETPWTEAWEDRFQFDSHRPLTIGQSDQAFLVTRGHVDLFAVMPPGDGSPPRRWHLFRVANGGLILGLPAWARAGRGLEVIAVG